MGSNKTESVLDMKPKKSICIVGGGSAGLAALKNVISSNSDTIGNEILLEGILFEQSSNVGGVWNYDPQLRKTLFNNPMYNNLRVNLPKQMMRFLDFSPDYYESQEDYGSQMDVLKYMNNYADVNKLRDHIKVDRTVKSVKRILTNNSELPKWAVSVQNTNNSLENSNYEFDHVIICSGRERKPKYPENYEQIRSAFKGETMHSVNYTDAEKYRNQTVVLIGSGPSGHDIWIQLSKVAKHVYLSVHDFSTAVAIPENYKNLEQIRQLKLAKAHSVVTEDNIEINCDVIIFCTGYEYSYPFLEPGILDIKDGGKQVTPLYLHMIHMDYPTLCMLGIGDIYLPFLFNDCQSRFYVTYIRGDLTLPTKLQMMETYNYEQSYRKKYGVDGRKSHFFNRLQFPYMRELAKLSGFEEELEQVVPLLEKTFLTAVKGVLQAPFVFKNRTFNEIVEESFTYSGDPTEMNFNFQEDPFQLASFISTTITKTKKKKANNGVEKITYQN